MLKSCTLAAAFAAGFGSLLSTTQVAAQPPRTDVTLRAAGITVVGTSNGRTVAGTLSRDGCSWQDLGPAKLDQDYVLHGTAGDDSIRLIRLPTVAWCARVLAPVDQQGHAFVIHGEGGDDTIYGGGNSPFPGNPNWVFGDAGNDTLYVAPGGSRAEGGAGNDTIYGDDNPGDSLLGGDGDDVLCQRYDTTSATLDGGDGRDVSCTASVSDGAAISVELFSCLACSGF
jgi:Ca2+-binding RTX toxin-like protein